MITKKTLLIGTGEIGTSVKTILEEGGWDVATVNKTEKNYIPGEAFTAVHVAIPYTDKFVEIVNRYLDDVLYDFCIIESTVPVGTCEKFDNPRIIHSPVRGIHPNLVSGIKTFVKFLGGHKLTCELAQKHYEDLGITTHYSGSYKTTELLKILSTSYYAWSIIFASQVNKLCNKYGLDYQEVYTNANITYNDGYTELLMPNVVRPVLYPPTNGIGGHCQSPNAVLLDKMLKELGDEDIFLADIIMKEGYDNKDTYKNKDWLYCEAIGKGKTCEQIAIELGVDTDEVLKYFKEL